MEIRAISINLSAEIGIDDALIWVPVVPDGRDGKVVFARSLRAGEINPGVPVIVEPSQGEVLQFKPGAIEISIHDIDRHAQQSNDGFKPISNTLWTWLTIGSPLSTPIFHYILAAGRRLDGTHSLLVDVRNRLTTLSGSFIHRREQALQAFALAEILVVALGRAVDLAQRMRDTFNISTTLPIQVTQNIETIRELRNAFEHIEDRAMGQVRGKQHPDALSIFDQREFMSNNILSYGTYRISLGDDIAPLLVDLRNYLFEVAVEFAGPAKQLAVPVEFFQEQES